MIGWVLATALAAAPDRAPATISLPSSTADGLVVSGDGRLVAAIGGGAVHLLDTEYWTVETISACTATSVALEYYALDTHYLWVGCAGGGVRLWLWQDGVLGAVTVEGEPLAYEVGEGEVQGVWSWDQGGVIYVLADATEGSVQRLHVIDADSGAVDEESGFPIQVPYTGFVEGVATTTRLVLFHGGSQTSQLTWGSASLLPNLQNYPYDVSDAAPSVRDSAYVVAGNVLAEYVPSSFVYSIMATDLDAGTAVAASMSLDDEWLLVADGAGVRSYALTNGTISGGGAVHTFDPGPAVRDLAVARWGYAIGATSTGDLLVLTANPWVDDVALAPAAPGRGDPFTLTFTVDREVEFEVFVGGDAEGSGVSLGTGSLASAGTGSIELTVGDAFAEGDNPVFVLVRDDAGLIGHGVAFVTLDDPPPAPDVEIVPSDGALEVRLDAGVADAARYAVYVTVAPFEPADYPTGGPAFDGTDAIVTPVVAEADTDGRATVRIGPLQNDVTYYIAARATDQAGQEGAMSEVVQGVPQPLQTAADLAGEAGGGPSCGCSSAPGGGAVAGVLLALGFVRRRRRAVALAALAASLALSAPRTAAAQTDQTPAWANVEVRYGLMRYDDDNEIVDVYGKSGHDQFSLEIGGQFARFVEVDFGMGFNRDSTFVRDDEGVLSDEGTALVQYPLYLDVTGRVHLWDEQILVPFARVGVDYVLWREVTGAAGGTRDHVGGGKAGWHWGVGGQVLLDTFAPRRASLLEAATGINDSWLTIEWRRQRVEPGQFLFLENTEGLSFSGDLFQIGLKIDY